MIQYQTQFPLPPSATEESIWAILDSWVAGSPHNSIEPGSILMPSDGDQLVVKDGNITAISSREMHESVEISGFQLKDDQPEETWRTEIIFARDSTKLWCGLRTLRESPLAKPPTRSIKKPIILQLLAEEFSTEQGNGSTLRTSPRLLEETEEALAAQMINAVSDGDSLMPLVYASYGQKRLKDDPLNVLAKRLCGLATVIVEPSRAFSFAIQNASGGSNVYGGAVGVHWSAIRTPDRFFPGNYESPLDLVEDVADHVRSTLLNQRLSRQLTWDYLDEIRMERLGRARIEAAKAGGDEALDELAEESTRLITNNQKLSDQLEKARVEIQVLEQQLSSAQARRQTTLKEFYPGEADWHLRHVLTKFLRDAKPDVRQTEIVEQILDRVPPSDDLDDALQAVKDELSGGNAATPKLRKTLRRFGIDLSTDNHPKFQFTQSSSYLVTMAGTAGDVRSGKNSFSNLKKHML